MLSQNEQVFTETKPWFKLWSIYVLGFLVLILVGLYLYSQSLIRVEAPKEELGEKVIITMPSGKTVYTYENLIVEEKGKLLYKGELNTIDLTGGVVEHQNWE
ncbi:hypothetical protein [Niallia endozanthoxylica]|uniref:Uncharacterized protein n=1 Tax=Niallia endozanthoxylica TaxID=2036016 RepID=A0A5J5HLP8_9BACI|nr:hypothetical protein [Niallia endozanthoxylica]KAA9021655.1 hypothetical protein F4V44_16845 [Niallia endozanthoxylica]